MTSVNKWCRSIELVNCGAAAVNGVRLNVDVTRDLLTAELQLQTKDSVPELPK